MIPIAPDPAAADLLTRAGKGDIQAQGELTTLALDQTLGGAVTVEHGIGVAEAWARLAASHGHQAERLRLAGVLILLSMVAEGRGATNEQFSAEAEAVAILGDLADEGNEDAANQLQAHAHSLHPNVLKAADEWLRECKGSE